MKLLAPATALLVLLASGCANSPSRVDDHWSAHSVSPRVARAFLGYEPDEDGDSYRDFQWKKKQAINTTVARHFFNVNPENPFQQDVPALRAERPVHSIVPYPWHYIHLEGLAIGAAVFAGTLVPLPVDSLIGTFEEGGGDEFVAGFEETFTPVGVVTVSFIDRSIGRKGPFHAVVTKLED